MRSKFVAFVIVVALSVVTARAQNQIPNWEFDESVTLTSLWNLWQSENFTGISTVQGAKLSGRNAMKIDIGTGSLDPLLVFRSYLKLEQGKTHYISFMAKADAPRPVTLLIQARALHSWQVYWSQDIQLTTEPQTFNFEYTHTGATVGGTGVFDSDIDFHFNLAGNGTDLYVDRIWMGTEKPPALDKTLVARPFEPVPGDGDGDVPADTSLSWEPGVYAQTHNVYLGASYDDVNDADITKAVSKGQTGTTFQPASLLEYGKTYYWRVDEVNAPPTNTVFKGDVWSFTVEPYAYTITGVTATASSSTANMGPEKTTNGSGLTGDVHSSTDTDMWLCAINQFPAWIQYAFDQPYVIQQMKVWNQNQKMELAIGWGAKDVLIEYSLDGTAWTALDSVVFPQADGSDTYAGFTIDMHNVQARFVRLTINSPWGIFFKQAGLSEVRFQYVPVQARQPSPAVDSTGVAVDSGFSWRGGRTAASHKIYFNTDKAKVVDGTALVDTTTDTSYQPPSLDFGKLYYWKVDEVNTAPASDWPGNVWSFVTTEWAAIDDFESYTNDSPNRVFQTWIDGWGFSKDEFFPNGDPGNATSSMVGYDPAVGQIMENLHYPRRRTGHARGVQQRQ